MSTVSTFAPFTCLPAHQNAPFLSLEELTLENQEAALYLSSLQDHEKGKRT